jgi:hypothetical protein
MHGGGERRDVARIAIQEAKVNWIDRPRLWNRGAARASLMGREPTMNPSPQATAMLHRAYGRRLVDAAVKKHHRSRRPFHRGNPAPALIIGAAKFAKSLSQRFSGSPRYEGGPLVTSVQGILDKIQQGSINDTRALYQLGTSMKEKHRVQWKKVWDTELPPLAGSLPAPVRTLIKQLDPTNAAGKAGAAKKAAQTPVEEFTEAMTTPLGQAVTQAVTQSGRQSNPARYSYQPVIDAAGNVIGRKRVKVPGTGTAARGARAMSMRVSPAMMKAGVVIGGLAAGYYIGSQLNNLFAGRALGKEEAGVAAALAFRRAREAAANAKGAPLTAAEVRSMSSSYKAQLIELGYDPVTFTRKRSGFEDFFTGQEEE